jgi:hypothetical protein
MLVLDKEYPLGVWPFVIEEIDSLIGHKSDKSCTPYHKQGLILPWKNYMFASTSKPYKISDKALIAGLTAVQSPSSINDISPTPPPTNFDSFKTSFIEHVRRNADIIDDYEWWMRTYLMPLSRYVVYDKSLTQKQALELIGLTTDNLKESNNNKRMLRQAIQNESGEDLYAQYRISVEDFYADMFDYSPDGFVFKGGHQ